MPAAEEGEDLEVLAEQALEAAREYEEEHGLADDGEPEASDEAGPDEAEQQQA